MNAVRAMRACLIACVLTVASALSARAADAYDFEFTSIDGEPLPLAEYRGRPLLVVNTASFCGFTGQYEALQTVWSRYRQQGLVVIGVPSNDFGAQEPGSEGEIKQFCEVNFNVDFPMTAKTVVIGNGAHPFYRWAASELGAASAPRWNFHKYLISPTGSLVASFPTMTAPTAEPVTRAIESELDRIKG